MASEEMVSCRDFLTLNDDQLVDLLQKFRQAEGGINIPVSDLDEVSNKDMQRIRTRLLSAQQLMKARAVSLDLDRVNELLMVDDAGEAARLPSLARDSASTDDESNPGTEVEDLVGDALVNERKSYAELIADGGRPLYPIEMLESVAKDPEQHRYLLQPYWQHPGINYATDYHLDWEVFQRQLRQHKAFRNWQLDNRGIIEEPDFDAYVEQKKANLRKDRRGRDLAEIESNPESLKGPNTHWEWLQDTRARERRQFREPRCSSFPEYHAALQRRLADHGFSEKTTLLADPKKQDALAEWHEYLGFECWWQDQYIREYKGRLKRYDQNWEFIQRQEWVTSDHTPEYLENWRMSGGPRAQRQEARLEVEKAKSKVEKARQHMGIKSVDGDQKGATSHALDDALQQLAEAEKRSKELARLHDVIATLHVLEYEYKCVKAYVDSQPTLIQWVIDQIPLIKAEMKVKAHSSAMPGSRKRSAREDGEDASAPRSPKLRKLAESEETGEPEGRATVVPEKTAFSEQTATLVPNSSRDGLRPRGKSDADEVSSVAQPRRSARLSAKQNRTVAPTVPDRKTRVKKPARSAATRREKKPSTKVDTDTGKRAKRGGNNFSKPMSGK
ncbi:hypothetical protein MY11210_001156 [Beauveria gryllotalpidicola]